MFESCQQGWISLGKSTFRELCCLTNKNKGHKAEDIYKKISSLEQIQKTRSVECTAPDVQSRCKIGRKDMPIKPPEMSANKSGHTTFNSTRNS